MVRIKRYVRTIHELKSSVFLDLKIISSKIKYILLELKIITQCLVVQTKYFLS